MPVAIVTGASQGLGRALAVELADRGWSLVIDSRTEHDLTLVEGEVRARLAAGASLGAEVGDVTDPGHRRLLMGAAEAAGGLDLVVNNASTLGVSPLPFLARHGLDAFRRLYEVNVVAPLALLQEAIAMLRRSPDARVVNVTSDAAVEPYEGWGGYGSSKAALDHLSAVLAVEEPWLRVWALDPGDMRTGCIKMPSPERTSPIALSLRPSFRASSP